MAKLLQGFQHSHNSDLFNRQGDSNNPQMLEGKVG
jgi:hypothetical protein